MATEVGREPGSWRNGLLGTNPAGASGFCSKRRHQACCMPWQSLLLIPSCAHQCLKNCWHQPTTLIWKWQDEQGLSVYLGQYFKYPLKHLKVTGSTLWNAWHFLCLKVSNKSPADLLRAEVASGLMFLQKALLLTPTSEKWPPSLWPVTCACAEQHLVVGAAFKDLYLAKAVWKDSQRGCLGDSFGELLFFSLGSGSVASAIVGRPGWRGEQDFSYWCYLKYWCRFL